MGYFDKFNSKGIPFMDNRDKGNAKDLIGKPLHIDDFGFIKGDEGDYAVFIVKENDGEFFFGNTVITDVLKQVDADNMRSYLPAQEVEFSIATSKKGREYMRVEFKNADAEPLPF